MPQDVGGNGVHILGQHVVAAPHHGQRVPFETAIGLELAITPPDVLAPKCSGNNQLDQ